MNTGFWGRSPGGRFIRVLGLVLVVIAGGGAGCAAEGPAPSSTPSGLDGLVAAERAFAQASLDDGMRAAFLDNLADSSILFRPLPTDGRAWFEARPPSPGTLSWTPAVADVAGTGDLGYTSGPWTYRADTLAAYGHYVSLWRRQADGSWRVELDTGIGHPEPAPAPTGVAHPPPAEAAGEALSPSEQEALRVTLFETDRALGEAAGSDGVGATLRTVMEASTRVYRDGDLPRTGTPAVAAWAEALEGTYDWEPSGAGLAASGDFGYTYGLIRRTGTPEGSPSVTHTYLRVWKRRPDGNWVLALDLATGV